MKLLPADLVSEFEALANDAWKARDEGNFAQAESLLMKAWQLIPEPIFEYAAYPQVYSRLIVELYRDSNQPAKAEEWLKVVKQAYSPLSKASAASIDFLEATVWHDGGKLDEAFAQFKKVYKQYKVRPFQDQNPRWKEFFFNRLKLEG